MTSVTGHAFGAVSPETDPGAARDYDWRGVEHLVNAGADVNLGDDEQPLAVAASAGNVDSINLLISAGADPNQADSDGWTALMFAAETDAELPVKILLAAAADPAHVSRDGRTAASIGKDRGHLELASLLDERTVR
jgi:ankyrin repeat protein